MCFRSDLSFLKIPVKNLSVNSKRKRISWSDIASVSSSATLDDPLITINSRQLTPSPPQLNSNGLTIDKDIFLSPATTVGKAFVWQGLLLIGVLGFWPKKKMIVIFCPGKKWLEKKGWKWRFWLHVVVVVIVVVVVAMEIKQEQAQILQP